MRWLLLMSLMGCPKGPPTAASPPASAESVFQAYVEAVSASNGEEASTLVSAQTLSIYGEQLDLAREATEEELRAAPEIDRLFALMVRHMVPKADLDGMTQESLFAYAVAEGWVAADLESSKVLAIDQRDGLATVHLQKEEEQETEALTLRCEGGPPCAWKIDLAETLLAMRQVEGVFPPSERELYNTLEKLTGRVATAELWDPQGERTAGVVAAPPDPALQEAFATYRNALQHADGTAAAHAVTQSTIDYYERLRNHALTLPRENLNELDLVDQLTVLILRQRIGGEKLRATDGRSLISLAVTTGLIGIDGVKHTAIGDTEIDGDRATARLVVREQPSPYRLRFANEEGWKVDLTSLMEVGNTAMEKAIEEMELEVDEFLLQSLGLVDGKPASDSLWDPPT